MNHVFWVYPDAVAGRPGPGVAPWNPFRLKSGGIDVILSVATDLFPHSSLEETGLLRVCIPFPDVLLPDEHVVALCRDNLRRTRKLIRDHVAAERRVLVHCAGGCDRTGLVLADYMVDREGISSQEALSRLRQLQPLTLSARGWEEMAHRLLSDTD